MGSSSNRLRIFFGLGKIDRNLQLVAIIDFFSKLNIFFDCGYLYIVIAGTQIIKPVRSLLGGLFMLLPERPINLGRCWRQQIIQLIV